MTAAVMSAPAPVPPAVPATRPEALRCRVVRRHLGLQGLGQVADAAVALTITRLLLLEMGGANAQQVTTGIAVSVTPAVLSLPIAWAIADSLRRNASLAFAHLARAVIAVMAVLVPLTSSRTAGFGVIAAITAAQTITGNLRAASLGHAVETSRLVAANSLAAVTGKAAGLLGIGLFVSLHLVSSFLVLAVAAALHLLVALGYHTWSTDLGGRTGKAVSLMGTARLAWSALGHPTARGIVPTTIALRAVQGASMVTFLALLEHRYGNGKVTTTAALGCTSAGAFVGMVLAPNYWRRNQGSPIRRLLPAAVLVASAGAIFVPTTSVCLTSQFLVSLGFGMLRVRADSAMQEVIPADARGRVMAGYDATYHIAFVSGSVLAAVNPYAGRPMALTLMLAAGASMLGALHLATVQSRRGAAC